MYGKTVGHQPRSVRIGKNCTLCLKYRCSGPWAQSYPIRTSRPVNSIFITDSYKKHTRTPTHSLAAIGSQFSTVPCLYSMQTHPPPPFYTLKEILLALKPLDCPLWIHFSFEHCWHHFYNQEGCRPRRIVFDLLNIALRNIKTKTKKLSNKNVQFNLIPSYPYLQVLHTLKLYSQFEKESKKLIMLVCFPGQLVFIYHFDKVLLL